MDSKISDWRPGPTVCRCCLSEGCYKDISTEYFWMGKTEVYADMLSETFNLSISYSQSGGPNSNSRLICEPCISRLRDASEFKRQVQECEKTFINHLDSGAVGEPSTASMEIEAPTLDVVKGVKLEEVKLEKQYSDDEFDCRDFGDEDDDDDLDDQPLTTFATKVPKKESVDLLDLLDNTQITVKRKSKTKDPEQSKKPKLVRKATATVKAKASVSAKKVEVKPVEKKKKGNDVYDIGTQIAVSTSYIKDDDDADVKPEVEIDFSEISNRLNYAVVLKQDGEMVDSETDHLSDEENGDVKSEVNYKIAPKSDLLKHRNNIKEILICTNATPIRRYGGIGYTCCYCENQYEVPDKLKKHTLEVHDDVTQANFMKSMNMTEYVVKLDITALHCKICSTDIDTLDKLMDHLVSVHERPISKDINNHIFPFKFDSDDLRCLICYNSFQKFRVLASHMHIHYRNFVCTTCNAGFVNRNALAQHVVKHQTGNFQCGYCERVFETVKKKKTHERISHTHGDQMNKCGYCAEAFKDYRKKEAHIAKMHGVPNLKPKYMTSNIRARRNAEIVLRYSTAYPFRMRTKFLMCVYCCDEFEDPQDFRDHVNGNHEDFTITTAFAHIGSSVEYLKVDCTELKCRLCSEPAASLHDMAKHIFDAHKSRSTKHLNLNYSIGMQPYKLQKDNWSCFLCNLKLPSLHNLCRHTSSHYRKFTCDTCGRQYLTIDALKYHIKCSHSGYFTCRKCWTDFPSSSKKKEHVKNSKNCWPNGCVYCGERFLTWEMKQKHLVEQHGCPENKYTCPDCSEVFRSRKPFYNHYKLVHSDDSFMCSCCGLKFVTKKVLEEHRLGHTGEKQHTCPICSKAFMRAKSLTQHMWIHSESKRFVCVLCEKQFAQKISLKTHMRSHHPDANCDI